MQSISKALDLCFASPFLPLPKYYLKEKKEQCVVEGKRKWFSERTQRDSDLITPSQACPALQRNSSLLGLHLLG